MCSSFQSFQRKWMLLTLAGRTDPAELPPPGHSKAAGQALGRDYNPARQRHLAGATRHSSCKAVTLVDDPWTFKAATAQEGQRDRTRIVHKLRRP
jgi:hypothetical protein